jgi:hypothetical protein
MRVPAAFASRLAHERVTPSCRAAAAIRDAGELPAAIRSAALRRPTRTRRGSAMRIRVPAAFASRLAHERETPSCRATAAILRTGQGSRISAGGFKDVNVGTSSIPRNDPFRSECISAYYGFCGDLEAPGQRREPRRLGLPPRLAGAVQRLREGGTAAGNHNMTKPLDRARPQSGSRRCRSRSE